MEKSKYSPVGVLLATLFALAVPVAAQGITNLNIPDRPTRGYVRLADINLGGLFSVSNSGKSQCGKRLRVPVLQQMIEAVVFAVETVNKNKNILPNVKLGFALLDDCSIESIAAAQSLRFLPRVPGSGSRTNGVKSTSKNCLNSDASYNTYGQKLDEFYDVVGLIGPLRSSNSIAVSNILGPAHVPQISFLSTSDVLSRKRIHPYFMRVVPPDAYQMQAILEFISRQGWSYLSVLYSEGSYGEPAYEVIKRSVSDLGLCIASQHKLYLTMKVKDYCEIIREMMKYHTARVVLLVSGDTGMVNVFRAVRKMGAVGRFIWVGSDGWAERLSSLSATDRAGALGSLTTTFYAYPAVSFEEYFRNLKPHRNRNPWFKEFWERMFNCSFKSGTCDDSADITTTQDYSVNSQAVYGIDAVYTYAFALDRLLKDTCPKAKGVEARACINGSLLLDYLKNSSFTGLTGLVDFDSNGDRMGKYVIRQTLPGNGIEYNDVSIVDVKNSYQTTRVKELTWDYIKPLDFGFGPSARYPSTKHSTAGYLQAPLSVCSRLCQLGEQKISLESSCCWSCRLCRENEFLVMNFSTCQQCPMFTWPDASTNITSCVPIDPTYPKLSDAVVVIILCFSVTGMLSTASVSIVFVVYRNSRVIKASSRELSFFQLGAIFFGYFTMIVFMKRPSNELCLTSYFMFSLSFNWLYAPLLVKTIRIYRIFKSANEGRRTLKVISPTSQVILTMSVIFVQIIICFVVSIISTSKAQLTSPSRIEKYVELYCEHGYLGLTSFIVYNLTLVALCTVFAFKTRKLPDNFNESRFISMCVFTTLVIWSVIIPSFVTASHEYLRSCLLATALFLNHTVALIFLFITRLCAMCYVSDVPTEPGTYGNNQSLHHHHGHLKSTNSILPINTISNSSNLLKPGTST